MARPLTVLIVLVVCVTAVAAGADTGFIGEVEQDGATLVYKVSGAMPPAAERDRFPWLTVVSWKYDGSAHNGMPGEESNRRMIALEREIEDQLVAQGRCRHAYSRTGNNLKELVYYIADRERFMAAFNDALKNHPTYPIEINFYEDRAWEDLNTILELFSEVPEE